MGFAAQVIFLLPGLVIGITIHEAAHALSAKWLGDHYASRMGRISLNPLRHLSFWGTLALFVLGFGWGKPVPVNLYNFRRPKLDFLLTSLAGPLSNVLLCLIILGILFLKPGRFIELLLVPVFLINAILAALNLIPIPPLDGSKIWTCLIPGMRPGVSGKWSTIWLIVLIVSLYLGLIDKVMLPVMNQMNNILTDIRYYSPRPEDFPEVFKAPKGAYAKQYKIYPYDVNLPNWAFYFKTHEPYPAPNLTSFLEENMTQNQFRPLAYELSDPNKPVETPWQLKDMTDPNFGSWKKGWINNQEELIIIIIKYRPEFKKLTGTVFFALFKGIPETWDIKEYRNKHPSVL
jgi:Zn-dependent protease